MTEAEKLLWLRLRYDQLGQRFKRQQSIGPYVIDFYCPAKKVAIELDGSQHNEYQKKLYDKERTEYLNSLDIKVIRFWNDEIFKKLSWVIETIYASLE